MLIKMCPLLNFHKLWSYAENIWSKLCYVILVKLLNCSKAQNFHLQNWNGKGTTEILIDNKYESHTHNV